MLFSKNQVLLSRKKDYSSDPKRGCQRLKRQIEIVLSKKSALIKLCETSLNYASVCGLVIRVACFKSKRLFSASNFGRLTERKSKAMRK